jgi:hypothetical protein
MPKATDTHTPPPPPPLISGKDDLAAIGISKTKTASEPDFDFGTQQNQAELAAA